VRRALLVTLALAVLNAGPAGAQQREHGRFPRKWLMAGIGAVAGGLTALLYSGTGSGFGGPCTKNSCVAAMTITIGFGAGYLVGGERDQLYRLRYRNAPPLSVRGQALPLSVVANDISGRGGSLVAAGEEGVEVVLAGPRLERGDVRARGLRGVAAALPDPGANRLFVATATGLFGFALTGPRLAGNLLASGEVGALDVRGDLAMIVTDGALRSARLEGDSLTGLSAPRTFQSRVTDVAWDPERPIVWVLTETALIALAASDSGLADSLGAMEVPGTGRRLTLRGTTVAVAGGDGGAVIGDVSDPRAMHATAHWTGARFVYDVALSAGALYIAAGPEGLYVMSRSPDGGLSPLGLARGLGFVAALESRGDDLYLLDRTGSVVRRVTIASIVR